MRNNIPLTVASNLEGLRAKRNALNYRLDFAATKLRMALNPPSNLELVAELADNMMHDRLRLKQVCSEIKFIRDTYDNHQHPHPSHPYPYAEDRDGGSGREL